MRALHELPRISKIRDIRLASHFLFLKVSVHVDIWKKLDLVTGVCNMTTSKIPRFV